MAQNNKITTAELDFDLIKSNLKNFLQGQDKFKDYDFEGAGLSILLDLLAYNTHYNALYTNLAVNESFLDSASKRSNIVSRAKEIGYVPHSCASPFAIIDLVVTPTTVTTTSATLTLPAYQPFNATVDGTTYTFYNLEATTAFLDTNTNTYTFSSLYVYEGTLLSYRYVAAEGTKYIIPNENVDLSTLKIRVAENASTSARTTFIREENILNLDGTSAVYFVKEIEGELYELEFGNNVIGKALTPGNIVEMTYLSTNKAEANGAKTFSYNGVTLVAGSTYVTTISPAQGGVDIEPGESIKYNAPRAYAAQNRTVTVDDYKTFILSKYPEAESVNVWGGEDNIPPQYGRVFISIKPTQTSILTQGQKDFILQLLKEKNVVSITPTIVNPEYINVQVNATVYYNPRLTSLTASEIRSLVIQTIKDYNDTYLDSFSGVLKFSNLTSAIDDAEDSIISNITTIKLFREVTPAYNTVTTYKVELGNPIYSSGVPEQSLSSGGFYIQGRDEVMYIEDLPVDKTNGVIRMYYIDEAGNKVYYATLGDKDNPTINYPKGSITIPNLNVTGLDFTDINVERLIIKPQSNDVVSIRNQLVRIPDDQIFVNLVVDTVAQGDAAGGGNYQFTSSRN